MTPRPGSGDRQAPPLLGLPFVVAAGLAILLTGPLLLFNPWLVGIEQGRQGVPASLGTTQAEVDRVTGQMLGDLFLNGDFTVGLTGDGPVLEPSERSHMRDVGGVVRPLLLLGVGGGGAPRGRRRWCGAPAAVAGGGRARRAAARRTPPAS